MNYILKKSDLTDMVKIIKTSGILPAEKNSSQESILNPVKSREIIINLKDNSPQCADLQIKGII